ncbi:MAG TPA: L-histidine N(alpha)-methyltransferase [Rhizomicrobium sp.]|nr:L-histidine N(alpha)-methyltransferase [Rhizomicrobium sp.]
MSSAALAYSSPAERGRRLESEFALAARSGLAKHQKELPSKFFYDEEGSRLFDLITELPEYYQTRTEIGLFRAKAGEIASAIGPDVELVEFGAGSLLKAQIILEALKTPRTYVPIDISGDYLRQMSAKLERALPNLPVHPVIADFTKPLKLPATGARRAGFFPGSTIGNLTYAEALVFLCRAAALLKGGGMLIGVDLVKDPAVLHAAYNDAAGVTEAFNKNMLVRANRELDANFDLDAFVHYAFYSPAHRRIEMHLMSLKAQKVRVAGECISFAEGETIHTENSLKYTPDGFRALAQEAGFTPRQIWVDPDRLFSVHWLEAA